MIVLGYLKKKCYFRHVVGAVIIIDFENKVYQLLVEVVSVTYLNKIKQ